MARRLWWAAVLLSLAWPSAAQAAISFVGSCSGGAVNGGTVTLTLPVGTTTGDLVIVAYTGADNDGVDFDLEMVTADYGEVADLFADDSRETNLGVFYKVMGGTPDTTAETANHADGDMGVAAVCMVFRGVDPTTPFDVTSTVATGIDSFVPDPPAIDFDDAGAWVVIAGGTGHSDALTETFTMPTGYTTNAVAVRQDETIDATTGMGYNASPSDPENPGTITKPGSADSGLNSWAAVTMALRPGAGGGGGGGACAAVFAGGPGIARCGGGGSHVFVQ